MEKGNSKNASEPIYNSLKEAILLGEYVPMERLSESKIAAQFGTSRTPVRDAFRTLAEDGLLNIYPNRFVEVAKYELESIKNLGLVRLQLDILSIRLAIHYGSNADFSCLDRLAEECHAAALKKEKVKSLELDKNYHLKLSRISKNEFVYDLQSRIWSRTQFILASNAFRIENYTDRVKKHFDINEALYGRDEKLAVSHVKDHLQMAYGFNENYPPDFIENM